MVAVEAATKMTFLWVNRQRESVKRHQVSSHIVHLRALLGPSCLRLLDLKEEEDEDGGETSEGKVEVE